MSDRRTSPEEVIAAYAKSGLRPIRGNFYEGACGCPITALFVAETGEVPTPLAAATFGHAAAKWADEQFGDDYRSGFVQGFDRWGTASHWDSTRRHQGAADGIAVREAIENAGMFSPAEARAVQ